MKIIWREDIRVGRFTWQKWQDFGEGWITREEEYIGAIVTARWDKGTGTLNIRMQATGSDRDWMPDEHTVLEIERTREKAIRRTIEIAADWVATVKACIPPPDNRTFEKVKADFESLGDGETYL